MILYTKHQVRPGTSTSQANRGCQVVLHCMLYWCWTCLQLPVCWAAGRRMMTMADRTADPCHRYCTVVCSTACIVLRSAYRAACGGWLANSSRPGQGELGDRSVLQETRATIDR